MKKNIDMFQNIHLLKLLDSIGEGLILADMDQYIRWFNKPARELLSEIGPYAKINNPDHFIGMNLSMIHGPRQNSIIAADNFPHSAQIKLFDRFSAKIVVDKVYTEQGEAEGFILTWKDVTEFQKELSYQKEMLKSLYTPIIGTALDSAILVALTGTLTEERMQYTKESILLACADKKAEYIIFDFTGIWRVFFQWFGQGGSGWIKNPMAESAPDTTVRSYLKLLNIKANHRKVLATEKTAIISSANPHDASGFHSNIAFEVSGPIIHDILKTEQAVLNFSGGGKLPEYKGKEKEEQGDIAVQLLTEGKILRHVLAEIKDTKDKDEIWVGMFYLAERKIIGELIKASKRGVTVNLILDPNEHAFGQQKIGLPNRPVADELVDEGEGNIELRWFNTMGEQYHPKMIFIKKEDTSVIIGGSANFTRRNLYDLNFETDLKISAVNNEQIIKDMEDYFTRLWNNEDAIYTLPLKMYEDEMTPVKKVLYRLQKTFRLTTY